LPVFRGNLRRVEALLDSGNDEPRFFDSSSDERPGALVTNPGEKVGLDRIRVVE